jgi:4-diphosphocytidyl-2-C-methyl-D-erythritol kinase
VRLRLTKRIPVAAGLGGGSSDAAGTLLALNELAGKPLSPGHLHRLASLLGADVPFFLAREPAVGRGTGTQLSAVTLLPYWYLLVNPGVPLSTRWVYENLDLAGLTGPPATEAWDPEHPETWVRNDLGTVAVKRFPELAQLLTGLHDAEAWCQGISGSGPTLFGLFRTREAAHQAGLKLRRTFRGWLAVARGLTGPEPETTWEHQIWTI